DATDELDDHVDLRVFDDADGVVGEDVGCELHRALLGRVAHGHARHLQTHAGALGDRLTVLADELNESRPDGAAAEEPDADCGRVHACQSTGPILQPWPFVSCSPRTTTSCVKESASSSRPSPSLSWPPSAKTSTRCSRPSTTRTPTS